MIKVSLMVLLKKTFCLFKMAQKAVEITMIEGLSNKKCIRTVVEHAGNALRIGTLGQFRCFRTTAADFDKITDH